MSLDDFDQYGWLNTGDEVQGLFDGLSDDQFDDFFDEKIDSQSDVFSLQVGSLNIKFAMDHNGICHTIPRSDLEITYIENIDFDNPFLYFLLKDTNGNRYYFGQQINEATNFVTSNWESTTFDGKVHISAWYLYRIETHDQHHGIDITYQDHNYSYYSLQDCEVVRWKVGPDQGTVDDVDCQMTAEEVEISGRVISRISGLASKIDFDYSSGREDLLGSPKKLASIDVNTGSFTKTFTFHHGYFSDGNLSYSQVNDGDELDMDFTSFSAMVKKLRLISISIAGGDETLPSYEFDYYRPNNATTGTYKTYATVNKAIDAYGFANGKFANNDLQYIIPTASDSSHGTTITYGNGSDIRDSDGGYSVTTGLYTMTLPTGGTITYTYEPNSYFNNLTTATTEAHVSPIHFDCQSSGSNTKNDAFNLTQAEIDYGTIQWSITPLCINNPSVFFIHIKEGNDTIYSVSHMSSEIENGIITLSNVSPPLVAGTAYTLVGRVMKGSGMAILKHSTTGIR